MNFHNIIVVAIFVIFSSSLTAQDCDSFGVKRELKLGSLMPYTTVKIGNYDGYFLIDFGTTVSTIDLNGFNNGSPKPINNTQNKFENFDFFGSWGTVALNVQNHSNIQGIKQAGILGTDFLSLNIFTLDYTNKIIFRSDKQNFCSDSCLIRKDFKAVSTAGYYSNDPKKLNNDCTSNIPTVPIKIGVVSAVAQIDPGYDDKLYRYSVNINQAYFDALIDANIILIENPNANFVLTTCIAELSENVKAYTLPEGVSFSIISTDGTSILINSDINIFLKQIPLEAKKCGGIGTWQIPAAQIGASFLLDSKKVIFDPFNSKVWFSTKK